MQTNVFFFVFYKYSFWQNEILKQVFHKFYINSNIIVFILLSTLLLVQKIYLYARFLLFWVTLFENCFLLFLIACVNAAMPGAETDKYFECSFLTYYIGINVFVLFRLLVFYRQLLFCLVLAWGAERTLLLKTLVLDRVGSTSLV